MENKFVTTKIWKKTLRKIKVAAAMSGVSMVEFLDKMLDDWLGANE